MIFIHISLDSYDYNVINISNDATKYKEAMEMVSDNCI